MRKPFSRMFIVADKRRKEEFEMKRNYAAFQHIKLRVEFLDYENLTKQYEQVIESTKLEILI